MKRFLVLRRVPCEGWTMEECDTWEETEQKFYELQGYGGGEIVVAEYIPVKLVDARTKADSKLSEPTP